MPPAPLGSFGGMDQQMPVLAGMPPFGFGGAVGSTAMPPPVGGVPGIVPSFGSMPLDLPPLLRPPITLPGQIGTGQAVPSMPGPMPNGMMGGPPMMMQPGALAGAPTMMIGGVPHPGAFGPQQVMVQAGMPVPGHRSPMLAGMEQMQMSPMQVEQQLPHHHHMQAQGFPIRGPGDLRQAAPPAPPPAPSPWGPIAPEGKAPAPAPDPSQIVNGGA